MVTCRIGPGDGGKASRGASCDLDERAQPDGELGPGGPERLQPRLVGPADPGWVVEVPVQCAVLAGERWALLPGGVRQRDHVVDPPVEDLRDVLGLGGSPVDADLREDPDRQLVHALWLGSSGQGREVGAAVVREQRLTELAPGRVAVADEEDHDRLSPVGPVWVDGLDRALEVDELVLQQLQVGALLGDPASLPFERRDECRMCRPRLEALRGKPTGVDGRHAQATQRDDERQSAEVTLVIRAVPVASPYRSGQDPRRLVPTNARRRDPGPPGKRGDVHIEGR